MESPESERRELLAALQAALEARPEIRFAYLHGSFQAGGPYRDIDVAVWLDPARIADQPHGRYALDLGVPRQRDLRRLVDVRILNDAPLAFRYHALKGTLLVVRDREFLDELRARTWDDYFDFLPFARQYLREALSE